MASLDDRLSRLEEYIRRNADVLALSDGSEVYLADEERLDALLAAIDGEHHRVHDLVDSLHPDAEADLHELAELLKALGVGVDS
jgi:UDP-N-acetylenolpyruvoylglucosamine reductase